MSSNRRVQPLGTAGRRFSTHHRVNKSSCSSVKKSPSIFLPETRWKSSHAQNNLSIIGVGKSASSGPQNRPGSPLESWTYAAISRSSGPGKLSSDRSAIFFNRGTQEPSSSAQRIKWSKSSHTSSSDRSRSVSSAMRSRSLPNAGSERSRNLFSKLAWHTRSSARRRAPRSFARRTASKYGGASGLIDLASLSSERRPVLKS